LGNIFLADGQPTLFDAIEFNDDFACIDSFYDLAFLLMDLRAKALPELSCLVFNRYLEQMGDFGALAALPLFLSLRAAIRSHVSATMAQEDAVHRLKLLADAQSYLDQAIVYLAPKAPRLVACGGLSGSGKSQLARGLAPRLGPAPGALVLRSDVLRKRLMGVAPECRLSGDAYSAAMTERTYAALTEQAAAALADGHSVIADAVFARPDQRLAIESVAQQAGVPFHGVWLAVDAAVLRARVEGRIGDASDATAAVVDQQLTYEVGPITWTTIGSSGPVEATLAAACRLIPL
jgi:predicted kinase